MVEITTCEVCGNQSLDSVLDLGPHPLCDDLVTVGDSRVCREYPIEILYCERCATAHQHFQVPKQELFSKDYHYRARMTGSVLAGMKDLVNSCEKKFGSLAGKTVLDIGCNDGSLLDAFKARGCDTIGIEPTGAALESSHDTINAFFDMDSAREVIARKPALDFITFTNVFAHIEHLQEVVDSLKVLLNPKTVLVIENHYLGAILKTGQFDTFYHEHPRTYSLRSFEYIAGSLGLALTDYQFTTRYGGNVRVYLAQGAPSAVTVDENDFRQLFDEMAAHMAEWIVETRARITAHVAEHGKLRAKAFPGRAAILIKLLGLNEQHLSAVYEIKGSIKVGHYVPGTRVPILPEAELYREPDQTQPILNFAWHIAAEVRANLLKNGYTGSVIDLKQPSPAMMQS
ncbi:MAG: class I SAM-dependent methyltransferase [Acidobacteriota bacterium]|nr:class I SAM-dependent methyltransferase [Acidobacteriota bacterium]